MGPSRFLIIIQFLSVFTEKNISSVFMTLFEVTLNVMALNFTCSLTAGTRRRCVESSMSVTFHHVERPKIHTPQVNELKESMRGDNPP